MVGVANAPRMSRCDMRSWRAMCGAPVARQGPGTARARLLRRAIGWMFVVSALATLAVAQGVAASSDGSTATTPGTAEASRIAWGVNGHPLVSYPGVTMEEQAALLSELGATSYRVDVSSLDHLGRLAALRDVLAQRRITVLPVLLPPVDLKTLEEAALRQKARAFAETVVKRFPDIPVWELGNELDNFAIIQPCEMKDDGTQYPCEWGPAGGVGPLDYYGPRYRKVAAVLGGLSEGVAAVNPDARRALGTAGWGRTGIFSRLASDGVAWDISVWHWYGEDPEWAFKILAAFNKPIWVTEFNHPYGSQRDGEEGQAKGLAAMMGQLQRLAGRYRVEAAHVYELLDESYWAPNFEAYMGLVNLVKTDSGGWRTGKRKPAFAAFQAASRPHSATPPQDNAQ